MIADVIGSCRRLEEPVVQRVTGIVVSLFGPPWAKPFGEVSTRNSGQKILDIFGRVKDAKLTFNQLGDFQLTPLIGWATVR